MEVKITVEDGRTLEQLRDISPERFMRAWAVAIKNLAKRNAQEAAKKSGGRSFWQREILPSVHEEVSGSSARICSDSYIAEHVHTGGVIRPRQRKYLAIPLSQSLRKKSPRDLPWHTEDGKPVFLPRKRGPGWVMFDYAGRGKNRKLRPYFALVPETAPQKPRPWWPDDAAVQAETERFFREDF
jgi:hypothetical protein